MLSGMDPLLTIGYNVWVLTTWFPVFPWAGWTAIHADFSRVDIFPASIWRASHVVLILTELSRWISVINAITFFLLFGMTDEARRHYKSALQFVVKRLGYKTGQSGPSKYVVGFNLIKKAAN
jgi:pheromone a factor receptor